MATQYIKYAKKCEKSLFFQIMGGGAMSFLAWGWLRPCCQLSQSCVYATLKNQTFFKIENILHNEVNNSYQHDDSTEFFKRKFIQFLGKWPQISTNTK